MNKYRTQYYDFGDLAIPNELMKCEEVLNDFGKWNSYKSIDQIIELYNVKRYIDSGIRLQKWTDEIYSVYQERAKTILGVIGRFFSTVDLSEYAGLYKGTDVLYKEIFWDIFAETKQYKNLMMLHLRKWFLKQAPRFDVFLDRKKLSLGLER